MNVKAAREWSTFSTLDHEKTIGHAIRRWRVQSEYTQTDLAARANVSRSAVQALERGTGTRLHTLIQVLQALGREDALAPLTPSSELTPIEALAAQKRAARAHTTAPRARRSSTTA